MNKSPYEELLERLDALATEWGLVTESPRSTGSNLHEFCIGQDSGYANCAEELKELVRELSDQ